MNGIFDPNTHIKTITLVGVGGTGASPARIFTPDAVGLPRRFIATGDASLHSAARRGSKPGAERKAGGST